MGDADPVTVAGWVWESNVHPFLRVLSWYVGYDFDLTDWEVISLGLEDTDDEKPDRWYTYELFGVATVGVQMARCRGDGIVMLRVIGGSTDIQLRAETLLAAYAVSDLGGP
jgi:hypothetical protein